MGSRIIFNIALGPRHVRMTSATVCRISSALQDHLLRAASYKQLECILAM